MTIELLFGLAIGLVMALTGAGGGILAVPLLMFGLGLELSQAAPVALLAVGLAAALGAGVGFHKRMLRYRAALWMAVVGVPAAPIGVWLAHHVDGQALSVLFGMVLLFVAWRTFSQADTATADTAPSPARSPPCLVNDATGRFVWTLRCARLLAGTGAVAGLLSGLLGVGGGFVMVPALKRYSDLPMQSIIATSLGVIALVALSGVATSFAAGTLDERLALPFAGGALLGMLGGSFAAPRLAGPLLQKGFAVIAGLVATGMLLRALMGFAAFQ